jgi:hypothetical protein
MLQVALRQAARRGRPGFNGRGPNRQVSPQPVEDLAAKARALAVVGVSGEDRSGRQLYRLRRLEGPTQEPQDQPSRLHD